MKAVRIHRHGGPEVLSYEDVPDPRPGPGEVTVGLRGASVNRLDLRLRAGLGRALPLPWTLGLDGAGVVTEVGSGVVGITQGQEVMVTSGLSCGRCPACLSGWDNRCSAFGLLGMVRPGTYAERVVVPAANVTPKPSNVTFAQAAAFPLVFTTVWHMLSTVARVRAGDRVLVHAAGSGVGSAAIQVARLLGARVLATAGTPEKVALARDLGAEEAVDYVTDDFVRAARRWTDDEGVDVVVDSVGGHVLQWSLQALGIGGRIVTCGTTAGPEVEIDIRSLYTRQQSIQGVYVGRKADFLEAVRHLAAGRLHPVVYTALPLREAPEAHRLLEGRRQFGKVVLVP